MRNPTPRPLRAHRPILASVLLAALCAATVARAEPEVELRLGRGPYHVGVPIPIHVQTTGLAKEPEPSCEVRAISGGSLRQVGLVPNFSSSVQIINGRVFKSESITFTCQFEFVANAPGAYVVGPFDVHQQGVSLSTERARLDVKAVPVDERTRIRLILPDSAVYLGQNIEVSIEWWLDSELRDRIHDYSIRSELFDRDGAFRFLPDEQPKRGQQTLEIDSAAGTIALPAEVAERRDAGRDFLVVTARRTLVPLAPGEFALEPATINLDEVTRWQRDLFGGRRPAGTRRVFARDEARTLVVKAPPATGRPASFSGAVGHGFSLEVSADRSVVQLGDPITLTFEVRGDGNLASVGPPLLRGPGGLPSDHFRLPDDTAIAGSVSDGVKTFRLAVRVLDDSVREIPAIEYSWFDPDLAQYQSTRSRPIALSVGAAQVISAADVVAGPSASAPATANAGSGPSEGAERDDAAARRSGSMNLVGADLSIEQRPERLRSRDTTSAPLLATVYGVSSLGLVGALVWRRRSDVDPALRRRRETYRRERARALRALDQPGREGLSELASALRELRPLASPEQQTELDASVLACDAVLYAPDASPVAGDSALDAARRSHIRGLLEALEESVG